MRHIALSKISALLILCLLGLTTRAQTGSWNLVTSVDTPTARHECSFVQLGDQFYLLGGRGIKPVDRFNPTDSTWVHLSQTPEEFHHFQATEYHGLLYVICAFRGTYPIETGIPYVQIYDPLTDSWINGMDIPPARVRGSAGVVLYHDKFYVAAGIINGHLSGWVPWFDEFDPATNTWTPLTDAPRSRDHFSAALVGDKLVSAGGRRSGDGGGTWDSTVAQTDVYDFISQTWETLPSPQGDIPTQRAAAMAGVIGNEVILIGGETADSWPAHQEVEALNVDSGTWRSLAPLLDGRHGTQAISTNDGIYVCAGAGSKGCCPELDDMEAFYFGAATTPGGVALTPGIPMVTGTGDFGNTAVNDTAALVVTLSHLSGNQAILITDLQLESGADFSLDFQSVFPLAIAPGKTLDVDLQFHPALEGSYTDRLIVYYGFGSDSLVLDLSGESGNCDEFTAPTGLSSSVDGTGATLSWDAIPGVTKCEIKGHQVGSPSFASIRTNTPPFELFISSSKLTPSTLYEWQVRCACSLSPLVATPYSPFDTFTSASLRKATNQYEAFTLSPNPASDRINLSVVSSQKGLADWSVYNLQGHMLKSGISYVDEGHNNILIDLTKLNTGMYLLEFQQSEHRQTAVFTVD